MSSAYSLLPNYDLVGSDYSMISGKGTTGSGTTVNSSGYSHNSGSFSTNPDVIGSDFSLTSGKGTTAALTTALNSSGFSGSSGGSYYGTSGSASRVVSATPQIVEYLDAPYAAHYGMDLSTAYNEALANTAYQRKVKDLLAAGLNPVLGISGSGANNFYGTPLQVLSDGSSYSSGGSYGSSGSGKTTLGKVGEQLIRNAPTIVGGIVTAVTKNFSSGYAASQVMQGISNIIRYS